ncbi:chymotrypsin inhibitor-like [Belonocnema kinseyi]|uniref:chymotrypsin inhibitor-like n=1 Tax=Belonocnema kinseyi TaxID=2817044 RepID=UPI00143D55A3|nr:chymotrypsin inhibitor-like [Belonocnema kinseyi]
MSPIFALLLIVAVASAQFEGPPSQDCGENEVFNRCGTACPKTCNDQRESRACVAICKIGCDCLPGYVRHDSSQLCVLPEEC